MSPLQHLRDLASLLVLLAGPLPLCLAAAAPSRRSAHRALVLLLCWMALQTAVGLLLGLAGRFSLPWLLAAEVLLFALGLVVFLRVPRAVTEPVRLTLLEGLLLGGLAALGAALLWVLSAFPTNEWDSLAYHLPAMAQWYQTGHLVRLPHDLQQTACYPYGWELLCALFLLPFRGDFLAMLPNLLAWALLGLAVYGLAREFGAARLPSLASAAALLALPSVVANVNTMHVDLAVAAFVTAAAYLLLRYARTRERWDACLCLGALALACGAKTSGILYAAPLALALLVVSRRGRTARAPQPLVPVIGALVTWGAAAFWYARNWLELGNPLAPLTVRLGPRVLFPGFVESSVLRPRTLFYLFRVADADHWRVLASALYTSGGLPFLALLLAAVLSLISLGKRSGPVPRGHVLLALLWAALATLLYSLTPLTGDSGLHGRLVADYVGAQLRTGFPFMAAIAVLAALGLTAVRVPSAITVTVALGSVLLALHDLRLLVAPIPFLLAWGLYRLAAARLSRVRWTRLAATALVTLLLVPVTYAARTRRTAHARAIYGPVVSYLDAHLPATEPIGYLLCPQNYLLYGPLLDRRVAYLPLRSQSAEEWRDLLLANHISLIAIGPDLNTYSAADTQLANWLHSPAGPLEPVFSPGPDQITLYRAIPH